MTTGVTPAATAFFASVGGLALFGILLDKWGVRVAGTLYWA
jgi:hypothetical protein